MPQLSFIVGEKDICANREKPKKELIINNADLFKCTDILILCI
jgi:hypothetical protein